MLRAKGFPPFWHLTFRQETFRHGHFITGAFWHVHVSALQTYQHMDILSPWTFRRKDFFAWGHFGTMGVSAQDISAPEHLGTWIFWHLAKQYGHFGTDIWAPVLLCRNVHVLKYPCAEIYMYILAQ